MFEVKYSIIMNAEVGVARNIDNGAILEQSNALVEHWNPSYPDGLNYNGKIFLVHKGLRSDGMKLVSIAWELVMRSHVYIIHELVYQLDNVSTLLIVTSIRQGILWCSLTLMSRLVILMISTGVLRIRSAMPETKKHGHHLIEITEIYCGIQPHVAHCDFMFYLLGRASCLRDAFELIKVMSVCLTTVEVSCAVGEDDHGKVVAEAIAFRLDGEQVFTFDPGKCYGLLSENAIVSQFLRRNIRYESHGFAYGSNLIVEDVATVDMQSGAYWNIFNEEGTTTRSFLRGCVQNTFVELLCEGL